MTRTCPDYYCNIHDATVDKKNPQLYPTRPNADKCVSIINLNNTYKTER